MLKNVNLFLLKQQVLVFLLVCLAVTGCQGQASNPQVITANKISRRDLFGAMRSANTLLVVYSTAQVLLKERYLEQLNQMNTGRGDFKVVIKEIGETEPEDWTNYPLLLVGDFSQDLRWKEIAAHLPLDLNQQSFVFDGQNYEGQHTIMMSYYPNPLNPRLPLSLVAGADEEAVLHLIENQGQMRQWRSWGYQIYHGKSRIILGNFSDSQTDRWNVDHQVHFDFSKGLDPVAQGDHFRFFARSADFDPQEVNAIKEQCEAGLSQIGNFLGKPVEQIKLDYYLYPSAEEKGLITNSTDRSHINASDSSIHTVVNQIYANNNIEKENELVLRYLLDKPKLDALEKGLALYFTDQWQVQGYMHWAARLYQSGNQVALAELLDNDMFHQESTLVMDCMAGSWVAFLMQHWGKEKFLDQYIQWVPGSGELIDLETAWYSFLAEQAKTLTTPKHTKTKLAAFSQGFNFTHEGYQIYNGYPSTLAAKSLKVLADKQSNTVALVPYTGMADPKKPSFLPFSRSPGGENDEGVIYSAYQAQQLGMSVMLKPQVWLRREWPGAVEMESEADWQQFFDFYYRWIRHYAMLAEIHQMDLFSVGVEFAKATLSKEDEWRKIIRKIRGLYSGHLTYAANWGEEFENVAFWDELDFIGLNCYYPLTVEENPSDKELKNNFKKVLKTARQISDKYNKPLLFTEIGFRSVDRPWLNPHEEAQDRQVNQEHQARCYEIVFDCLQDQSWVKGIYWWKWPTNLNDNSDNDRRFVPYGKTAEAVIDQWFDKFSSQ